MKLSNYKFISLENPDAETQCWELLIGSIKLHVYGGADADSEPKTAMPLDSYLKLEVVIKYHYFLHYINAGRCWCEDKGIYYINRDIDFDHGLFEPVENIIRFIQILKGEVIDPQAAKIAMNIAKKQEKPCRHCGRINDIGVIECWHCMIQNPTG